VLFLCLLQVVVLVEVAKILSYSEQVCSVECTVLTADWPWSALLILLTFLPPYLSPSPSLSLSPPSSQVSRSNIELMRQLVMNGPDQHPGANFIQQRGQAFKKRGSWPLQ